MFQERLLPMGGQHKFNKAHTQSSPGVETLADGGRGRNGGAAAPATGEKAS